MEKFYRHTRFLLLATSLLLLFSCQEGSEAGDLFGQWRLNGADDQYISFSGAVTRLQIVDQCNVYGNFQHRGDSIFIQCVSTESLPSDTLLIEQDFGFKPFTDIRLKIDQLDSDRLLLSKDGRQWVFTKW